MLTLKNGTSGPIIKAIKIELDKHKALSGSISLLNAVLGMSFAVSFKGFPGLEPGSTGVGRITDQHFIDHSPVSSRVNALACIGHYISVVVPF